jgi:uncharacterized protein with PIN domain
MKFLLENNLARLAKWLVFMGYDAKVMEGSVSLREVVKESGRVFITTSRRWYELCSSKGLKVVLVPRDSWELQLCSLVKQLNLRTELLLNRCPFCGEALVPARGELLQRVPPKALKTAKDFTYCQECDHLFWKGIHYERMKAMLESALSGC